MRSLALCSASEAETSEIEAASAETETTAEEILQNIIQIAEALAEVWPGRTIYAGETELVILGAFLRVGQY